MLLFLFKNKKKIKLKDKYKKSKYYHIRPSPPSTKRLNRPFIKPKPPESSIKRIYRPYLKPEKKKIIIISINMNNIVKKNDLKPYLFFNKSSYLGYFIKSYISNNYSYII